MHPSQFLDKLLLGISLPLLLEDLLPKFIKSVLLPREGQEVTAGAHIEAAQEAARVVEKIILRDILFEAIVTSYTGGSFARDTLHGVTPLASNLSH